MTIYRSSEQLYSVLESLFQQIQTENPAAAKDAFSSKLIIRLRFSDPKAELTINARTKPVKIDYGDSKLRPDLEVDMKADIFHQIMLGELPLGKAFSNGKLRVKGALFKSVSLADIFHLGQAIYPKIFSQGNK